MYVLAYQTAQFLQNLNLGSTFASVMCELE